MSRVLVSCDEYCYSANGKYYLRPFGIILFKRYLQVFDKVRIVVRTKYVEEKDLGSYSVPIEPNMEIVPISFFQGPIQYIQDSRDIKGQLKNIEEGCDACVVRLPSTIGFKVFSIAKRCGMPIGIEVVANPYELSQNGGLLSRLCWIYFHHKLVRACALADAVSYVTEYTLQQIYPAKRLDSYTTHYSSVELPQDFYTSARKGIHREMITLCHVSNPINGMAKGHKVFIDTVKILRDRGYNVVGSVVGDGPHLTYFKGYAKSQRLEDCIRFYGVMKIDELRQLYINSDIMLFPTLTEGLPRVIIEAMATGMPCLSTPVGGIPELLSKENLFDPSDVEGFANRILELITDSDLYKKESKCNFDKAVTFSVPILSARRTEMFRMLENKIRKQ